MQCGLGVNNNGDCSLTFVAYNKFVRSGTNSDSSSLYSDNHWYVARTHTQKFCIHTRVTCLTCFRTGVGNVAKYNYVFNATHCVYLVRPAVAEFCADHPYRITARRGGMCTASSATTSLPSPSRSVTR